jgi:hypothetical protein
MNARTIVSRSTLALVAALAIADASAQSATPSQRSAGPAVSAVPPATPAPTGAELRPGEGIGSVEVGIRKRPRGEIAATTRSDARGNFTFAGLPAGTYDVALTPPAQPASMAKSFFESRSNTVRLEVVVQHGTTGGATPSAWTWTPATGELAAMAPDAAQRTAPPTGIVVGAGDIVNGSVKAAARGRPTAPGP